MPVLPGCNLAVLVALGVMVRDGALAVDNVPRQPVANDSRSAPLDERTLAVDNVPTQILVPKDFHKFMHRLLTLRGKAHVDDMVSHFIHASKGHLDGKTIPRPREMARQFRRMLTSPVSMKPMDARQQTTARQNNAVVFQDMMGMPIWARLPLPQITLPLETEGVRQSAVPLVWWQAPVQTPKVPKVKNDHHHSFYSHKPAFKARLIVNSQMLENDKTLTHGDARRALVQCLVAAKKFFRYSFGRHPVRWWLDEKLLLGSQLFGGVLPWEVQNGMIAMTHAEWVRVKERLKQATKTQMMSAIGTVGSGLPLAAGKQCGCLFIDTESFGAKKGGGAMKGFPEVPGTIYNECTGNSIDIHTAIRTTSKNLVMSNKDRTGNLRIFAPTQLFKLIPCQFEQHWFHCPQKSMDILAKAYGDCVGSGQCWRRPDLVWDNHSQQYVPILDQKLTGRFQVELNSSLNLQLG